MILIKWLKIMIVELIVEGDCREMVNIKNYNVEFF